MKHILPIIALLSFSLNVMADTKKDNTMALDTANITYQYVKVELKDDNSYDLLVKNQNDLMTKSFATSGEIEKEINQYGEVKSEYVLNYQTILNREYPISNEVNQYNKLTGESLSSKLKVGHVANSPKIYMYLDFEISSTIPLVDGPKQKTEYIASDVYAIKQSFLLNNDNKYRVMNFGYDTLSGKKNVTFIFAKASD